MRRFGILSTLFLILITVALAGCGDKDKEKKGGGTDNRSADNKGGTDDKTPTAGALEELAGKGLGAVKGKVTFEGEPPARNIDDRMKAHNDKDQCLKDDPKNDPKDPTWIVGPDKGVKNVVVWLRPPKGKYFKIPDDQKKSKGDLTMDQPFCQFEPHVVAFFPSYFDGKKQVATGQKFEVLNSAPMNHNTYWAGDSLFNKGDNQIIKSKGKLMIDAKASNGKKPGDDLVKIACDLHKWMTAYCWVFDHPYWAITGPDGSYEIKNAPTGVDLELVYWHETFKSPKSEKVKLDDGPNTEDCILKK